MKCLRFGEVYPVPGYATLRCWFQVINTDDECRTARGPQEVGGGRYLNAWMGCADSRKEPDGFFFFFRTWFQVGCLGNRLGVWISMDLYTKWVDKTLRWRCVLAQEGSEVRKSVEVEAIWNCDEISNGDPVGRIKPSLASFWRKSMNVGGPLWNPAWGETVAE